MKLITSMLTASLLLAAPIVGAATWEERREAQIKLKAAGHDPGAVDGAFGEETRAALRAYQEENDLKVTGRLDDNTKSKLGVGGEVADAGDDSDEDAAAEEEANDEAVEDVEESAEEAEEEIEESAEEVEEEIEESAEEVEEEIEESAEEVEEEIEESAEEVEEEIEESAEEVEEEIEESGEASQEAAEELEEEITPSEDIADAPEEDVEEEAEELAEEESDDEAEESDEEESEESAPVAKSGKKRQAYSLTFAEVYARVGTADVNDDSGEIDFDDVTVSGRFSQQILDNVVIQIGTESLRAENDGIQPRVSYHNKYAEVLYRHGVSTSTDFYVGGGYFGTSFREEGMGADDASGWRARLGVSYKLGNKTHLTGEVSYRDLDVTKLDGPAADLSISHKVYGNWAVVLHGQYLILDEDAEEDIITSGGAGIRYYLD